MNEGRRDEGRKGGREGGREAGRGHPKNNLFMTILDVRSLAVPSQPRCSQNRSEE